MYSPESESGILSIFDVDRFFSHYYGDSSQTEQCVGAYPYDAACNNNTNNNGFTGHSLQGQFSGLSLSGGSGSLCTGDFPTPSYGVQPWQNVEYPQPSYGVQPWTNMEYPQSSYGVQQWPNTEYPQSSYGAQPWHNPSENYYSGSNAAAVEGVENVVPSNSYSSSGERYSGGGEHNLPLKITDEPEINVEISKQSDDMTATSQIPRIDGDIPSFGEASSDHERLKNRLKLSGLVENRVEGDGNCQFRALSDQFYRTPEYHRYVREKIVKQLKEHPEMYEGYVPMAYSEYLKNMVKNGEWGDHVTLQAAADAFGVKILVVTSFKDTCYIEIIPKTLKSDKVIYLSFWAEVHYNSIYPKGATEWPVNNIKVMKKKKWWNFKNKNQR